MTPLRELLDVLDEYVRVSVWAATSEDKVGRKARQAEVMREKVRELLVALWGEHGRLAEYAADQAGRFEAVVRQRDEAETLFRQAQTWALTVTDGAPALWWGPVDAWLKKVNALLAGRGRAP